MKRAALGLVLVLLGCAPDESGETYMSVVTRLQFGVEVEGVSPGFDLDGHVSARGDVEGCRREDFVAPDGTPGVDNQFSYLYDAIVALFGDAVDGLLQGVINDGTLLLFFELTGVNDLQNDDRVVVNVFSGAGVPDLGTDGFIAPSQTFDVREESPFSSAVGRIENGVLFAGPFDATIPVQVFQVFFDLEVKDTSLRAELNDDGSFQVMLGGGVRNEQILSVARQADAEQETEIGPLLEVTLRGLTDLAPSEDGRCTQTSATLLLDTVPAFLYEDAVRPE